MGENVHPNIAFQLRRHSPISKTELVPFGHGRQCFATRGEGTSCHSEKWLVRQLEVKLRWVRVKPSMVTARSTCGWFAVLKIQT